MGNRASWLHGAQGRRWKPGVSNHPETMWKPGQSGNPSGRTPDSELTKAYKRLIGKKVPEDPENRTFAEVIAIGMLQRAARGHEPAAREINDRLEGRPTVKLEVSGGGGGPLEILGLTLSEMLEKRDTLDQELAQVLATLDVEEPSK